MLAKWLMVGVLVVAVGMCGSVASASPTSVPRQTRAQAEVHLLRIFTRLWAPQRLGGLVDTSTGAPAVNTQARCVGHGGAVRGDLYRRFMCLLRPSHDQHGGLYVDYTVVAGGRCLCHWVAFRSR